MRLNIRLSHAAAIAAGPSPGGRTIIALRREVAQLKTVRIASLMVLASLVATPAFCQQRFAVEVAGGEAFNSLNSGGLLSNWGNGWTIGGGLSYSVMQNLDVDFNLSYDRYPYGGGNVGLVFPAIAGLNYSVTGHPSTAEEASLGLRFMSPMRLVTPFISVKGGLRNFYIGQIEVAQWFGPEPQNVSHSTYDGSGRSHVNLFASVGMGLMIPVNSLAAVSIEGRFSRVFDANEMFMPLVARVQLRL